MSPGYPNLTVVAAAVVVAFGVRVVALRTSGSGFGACWRCLRAVSGACLLFGGCCCRVLGCWPGLGRPGSGCGHGEGLAAPWRAGVFGAGRAARCWFSSCRVFHAARIRWLRTMSSVVVNSMSGARPIRRHQPRAMSLAAGSLMVAKPRSAPVRRA